MKNLNLVGKILFAVPMLVFGFGHFGNAGSMKGMVPDYLPAPDFFVYLTGIALVLAAVALFINKYAKLAMQLLGVMLLLFVLLVHLPGALSGNQMAMVSVLKDVAIAGGAFFISSHSKN